MLTLHDFSALRIDGLAEDLARYRGRVVLVVNTASACGYTPQYAGLEALQRRFCAAGFDVLAFPCNQFGAQEPGDGEAIAAFCRERYEVSFRLFAKVDVNGPAAPPLWQWLTRSDTPYPQAVKWNFTKFLIDQQGRVVRRYEPALQPEEAVEDILRLLRLA
ncbi:glutathione peroxidase [Paludibacterium yongneupense]|uniref:glutathione peroxidase n=1 Tax=Paludibacterium yongneupense TaxID=400061 RepID=UPI00040C904F|nr:glutathione peroxidase [Paludibacterium yongneupense]